MAYIVLTDPKQKKFYNLTKIISELSIINFDIRKNNAIEKAYHENYIYEIPKQYSNYQNNDDKSILQSFVVSEIKKLKNNNVSEKEITDVIASLPYKSHGNETLSLEFDDKKYKLNLQAIDKNSKLEIDKFLKNTIKENFNTNIKVKD